MNFLLQVDPINTAVQLTNYGPIGFLAFFCIVATAYLERIRNKRDRVRDEKMNKLEERFDKYQNEDRAKMLQVIEHNTVIMEEVVSILHKPII